MPGKGDPSGPTTPLDGFLDLPEDSLFTADDYTRMYRVAASETGHIILGLLHEEGQLSERTLKSRAGENADEFQAVLKQLQRAALITQRKGPHLEDSSYSISRLGKVVLMHGPKRGISILATEEECIEATYRDRDSDSH